MIVTTRALVFNVLLLIGLSLTAFSVNSMMYHYQGNNYFPPGMLLISVNFVLIYIGAYLFWGEDSKPTRIVKEICIWIVILSTLTIATNAIQLTPFKPIDKYLSVFEHSIGLISNEKIISWTYSHPTLKHFLQLAYHSLPLQMCIIPLLVIIMTRFDLIREYYLLLMISAAIGFTVYYFYPTNAPASLSNSLYYTVEQKATALKYYQIHHHRAPTTLAGGMIAFPSFHVIWAWFCLYLVREWWIAAAILLPINITLVMSCVLLGWHHCIDIVGSMIIIVISHGICFYCRDKV
ncbi:MAG: phosphatase PAP2 family protein [Legionella sp.]